MNNIIYKTILPLCLLAAFVPPASAQIAGGGNYIITQTATAGGGTGGTAAVSGGTYSIEGTAGQAAAGTKQQTSAYIFQPGFWTAQPLAPTAAAVSVSGRVVTASGLGIRSVVLTLTRPGGEKRTVITGSFGYFRFDEVMPGETCILSVSAKRYTFSQPVQLHSFNEDTAGLIFTADF